MSRFQLTPEIVAAARALRFDPEASRGFDVFAGGFVWTDEWSPALEEACRRASAVEFADFFRQVVGYRASVIRGDADEKLFPCWKALERLCPEWPGFRPERCSGALLADLERTNDLELAKFERDLDDIERRFSKGK